MFQKYPNLVTLIWHGQKVLEDCCCWQVPKFCPLLSSSPTRRRRENLFSFFSTSEEASSTSSSSLSSSLPSSFDLTFNWMSQGLGLSMKITSSGLCPVPFTPPPLRWRQINPQCVLRTGIFVYPCFCKFCETRSVWPYKNRQMSIKVAQIWFHSKIEWSLFLYKNFLTM